MGGVIEATDVVVVDSLGLVHRVGMDDLFVRPDGTLFIVVKFQDGAEGELPVVVMDPCDAFGEA